MCAAKKRRKAEAPVEAPAEEDEYAVVEVRLSGVPGSRRSARMLLQKLCSLAMCYRHHGNVIMMFRRWRLGKTPAKRLAQKRQSW